MSWTASLKESIGTINMAEVEPGIHISAGTNKIYLKCHSDGYIGINLRHYKNGAVLVSDLYSNGPAHTDGCVKLWDQVLAVNGQIISGHNTPQEVRNIIKGNKNTLTLTVIKPTPKFNKDSECITWYEI